ncbi:carboxypeptidase-like regulatory domain-containing protein [bacterium]|nr:carboxypeptidase-like regulatory domain-containing protein [bacterium]
MKLRIFSFILAITIVIPAYSLFAQSYDRDLEAGTFISKLPEFDMSRTSYNATGAIVAGSVTDFIDGERIEGAKVTVTMEPKPKMKSMKLPEMKKKYVGFTDADGIYIIQYVPCGMFEIQVKAEGYFEGLKELDIPEIGTYQVDFELNPCENGARGDLHGFVHDAITGDPIAGSKISFKIPFKCISEYGKDEGGGDGDYNGDSRSYEGSSIYEGGSGFEVQRVFMVVTDGNGEYLIEEIPIGEFSVSARAKTYETGTETALIQFGETTELNFDLIPCGSDYSGSISGLVTDEDTGAPIGDAKIFLKVKFSTPGCGSQLMNKVISEEDGSYSFDNLPHGIHIISAWAKGYIHFSGKVTVESGMDTEFDIILRGLKSGPKGTLAGIVIDSKSDPVEGASIKLYFKKIMGAKAYQKLMAETDEDGSFMIEGVPVGKLEVEAKKGKLGKGSISTEIFKDELTEVEIVISKKKSDD